MAMTREERRAYAREYYKKNKARIQSQQKAYREKNGIVTPEFIAPAGVDDVEWKSLSNKFLRGESLSLRDEKSGIGAFSDDWEDYIE